MPALSPPAEASTLASDGSQRTAEYPLGELMKLLVGDEPITATMNRFAQGVAEALHCQICGLAVRSQNEPDLTLRMSRQDNNGNWGSWNRISLAGTNGGTLTNRAHSRHATVIVEGDAGSILDDEKLEQHGIASALVTAIDRQDASFGVLGVYHDAPRKYSGVDVQFIETAAMLLATQVERHWLSRQLADTEAYQRALVENTQAAVVVLRRDGTVIRMNPAMETLGGFSLKEIRDLPFAYVFATASEKGALESAIRELLPESPPLRMQCSLHAKHGTLRRMLWTFVAMANAAEELEYLGTGIDVTDQEEARLRAERGEAKAKASVAALIALRTAVESGEITQIRRVMTEATSGIAFDAQKTAGDDQRARRAHQRYAFRSRQMVAPAVSKELPPQGEFFEVVCLDLSTGGISFLLPYKPDTREFVVAMGTPPAITHMRAEVRNCAAMTEAGVPMWRVGCKFTDRVHPHG